MSIRELLRWYQDGGPEMTAVLGIVLLQLVGIVALVRARARRGLPWSALVVPPAAVAIAGIAAAVYDLTLGLAAIHAASPDTVVAIWSMVLGESESPRQLGFLGAAAGLVVAAALETARPPAASPPAPGLARVLALGVAVLLVGQSVAAGAWVDAVEAVAQVAPGDRLDAVVSAVGVYHTRRWVALGLGGGVAVVALALLARGREREPVAPAGLQGAVAMFVVMAVLAAQWSSDGWRARRQAEVLEAVVAPVPPTVELPRSDAGAGWDAATPVISLGQDRWLVEGRAARDLSALPPLEPERRSPLHEPRLEVRAVDWMHRLRRPGCKRAVALAADAHAVVGPMAARLFDQGVCELRVVVKDRSVARLRARQATRQAVLARAPLVGDLLAHSWDEVQQMRVFVTDQAPVDAAAPLVSFDAGVVLISTTGPRTRFGSAATRVAPGALPTTLVSLADARRDAASRDDSAAGRRIYFEAGGEDLQQLVDAMAAAARTRDGDGGVRELFSEQVWLVPPRWP